MTANPFRICIILSLELQKKKQTQDESDKWVLIVQRDNLESHGQIPSQTCNTTSGLLV